MKPPSTHRPSSSRRLRLSKVIARGAAASLLLRVLNTLLMLGVQVALARLLGVEGYGVYVYATAVMSVLVILGKLGFDNAQLRFVSAYRGEEQWNLLAGLLAWTQRMSIGASLVVAAGLTVVVGSLRHTLEGPLVLSLCLTSLAIPFLALSGLRQAALRGLGYIVCAQIPELLIRPVLLLGLVGAFWLWVPSPLSAAWAMAMTVVVSVVVYSMGDGLLKRRMPHEATEVAGEHRYREWLDMAVFLLVISLINLLLNRTDVLLIGSFLGRSEVGVYAAAARLATVLQFGLRAVNLVAAPLIAEYHARGSIADLQRIVTLSGYGIFSYTTLVSAGLVVLGKWLLSIFGQDFTGAYSILFVLAIGNVGNALTGPASFVLSMTGKQRALTSIMAVFLAFNVLMTLLLMPHFGALGAAAATSTATIGWNVVSAIFVYRHFGLNCFAIQRLSSKNNEADSKHQ